MPHRLCLHAVVICLFASHSVHAEQFSVLAEPSEVNVDVDQKVLTINVPAGVDTLTIPNLHAPMAYMQWTDAEGDHTTLKITPLVDRWEIKFPKQIEAKSFELFLEGNPKLKTRLAPLKAKADGGFDIPAHHAHVVGEKLRYELQPWKNTVGYWVNVNDYVYFLIACDRPGKWNVGILQGCGKDQGGSDAVVSLHGPIDKVAAYLTDQAPLESDPVSQLEFKAVETGHFQNFIWRHIGQVSVETAGTYAVKISAKKIAKNAVMDVRAISLTRLPD